MASNADIEAASPIAAEVYAGLTRYPKAVSPLLFYDAVGSELFERITELPEYYLTRTERSILEEHAGAIISAAGPPLTLIELGAGTAAKTTILVDALLRQQDNAVYRPVDISASALKTAAQRFNGSYPRLRVQPIVSDYSSGVEELGALPGRKLVLYIGSSMGNFEPVEAAKVLRNIRKSLSPGDTLLLGLDMVKDPAILLAAYDDSTGMTAAFNKNILARINRELQGEFDLGAFAHVALWNKPESRIEMHLRSRKQQSVPIAALDLDAVFEQDELLHTENSYKFDLEMVAGILRQGGFELQQSWFDSRRWFGVHLAIA